MLKQGGNWHKLQMGANRTI